MACKLRSRRSRQTHTQRMRTSSKYQPQPARQVLFQVAVTRFDHKCSLSQCFLAKVREVVLGTAAGQIERIDAVLLISTDVGVHRAQKHPAVNR